MNNVIASTAGRLGRLRRRTNGRLSRGQSLVEFALVLPILLLLLLVALDFGRVYLGYINVQSMARIAANYAANNPLAWGGSPDATVQTRYENQILADASATNCVLPTSGGDPVIPPPVFLDGTDAGSTTQDIGDTARVQITCTFTVITPVISSIVGGTIPVSAESNFPVKTGLSGTASGGGGGGPIVPNAAFTGDGVVSAKTAPYPMLTDSAPFVVEFRDTSGGSPTSWAWNFGDGSTSGLQDPLDHQFDCIEVDPCVYNVSMTATNGNGSSTAYMDITVLPASAVAFTANQTLISPGMSVSFTDQSTPVGTEWLWDFGDGGTSTEQNPTHTYANEGTYDVSLTVTYDPPADPPVEPLVKNAYIRVETGLCTVPRLVDLFFNSADTPFEAAGFTGSVVRGPAGPANGNFKIVAQDLTATSLAPCTSDISVVGN